MLGLVLYVETLRSYGVQSLLPVPLNFPSNFQSNVGHGMGMNEVDNMYGEVIDA